MDSVKPEQYPTLAHSDDCEEEKAEQNRTQFPHAAILPVEPYQFLKFPYIIGNARSHGVRDPWALVIPGGVVI
jgi:hypothetical protein